MEIPKKGLFVWQDTQDVQNPVSKKVETRPYGPRRFAIDGREVDESEYTAAREKLKQDEQKKIDQRSKT